MKQGKIPLYESTSKQRTSAAITVYQQRASIAERRKNRLPKGLSELKYEDVAKTLEAESIHIRTITAPEGLTALERHGGYNYTTDTEALVSNYAGKPVKN